MPQHCASQRVFYGFVCGVLHIRVTDTWQPGAWGAGAATLACQKSRNSSHQTRANEKSGKSYL
eukprot:gene21303-biopygen13184